MLQQCAELRQETNRLSKQGDSVFFIESSTVPARSGSIVRLLLIFVKLQVSNRGSSFPVSVRDDDRCRLLRQNYSRVIWALVLIRAFGYPLPVGRRDYNEWCS